MVNSFASKWTQLEYCIIKMENKYMGKIIEFNSKNVNKEQIDLLQKEMS